MAENTDVILQIITGNAETARVSDTKGWVVGHMASGVGKTNVVEIKEWFYSEDPKYGVKTFGGTEFFNVVEGELTVELEFTNESGKTSVKRFVLSGTARDHIIIPPGCRKRILVTKAPASGITVRWPSNPGINVAVEKGS